MASAPLPVLALALALLGAPAPTLADGVAGDAAVASADAAVTSADAPSVSPSPDAFAVDESELSPPAPELVVASVASLPSAPPATVVTGVGPVSPVASASASAPTSARCPEKGDAIAVFTTKRELWLCVEGERAARFEVALGQAGTGKQRLGDRRTPVGTYALGAPRPSARYGTFIPIAYPTPEQAARGQTGGAVGIHGPPRKLPEPGYPTTAFDWTLGCVATGTDADVEAIAAFVRRRQPVVVIR